LYTARKEEINTEILLFTSTAMAVFRLILIPIILVVFATIDLIFFSLLRLFLVQMKKNEFRIHLRISKELRYFAWLTTSTLLIELFGHRA